MRKRRNYKNRNKTTRKYNTTYINSNPSHKGKIIALLTFTTLIIVATVIIVLVTIKEDSDINNQATPDSISTTQNTPTIDEATSDSIYDEVGTVLEVTDEDQPSELSDLLSAVQSSYSELEDTLGCTQLVTVNSGITDAEIKLWECIDGLWTESESHLCYGFVGSMGTVDNMSEDISGTPRGLYPIGSAFYQEFAPETGLDTFQITEDTYWVDDPDSVYYNQRVDSTYEQDWNSAEHMAEISEYKYGFVVNYNMPPVYNAGSAIFFHIGSSPTAGCIATSEDMVLSYLSALDHDLCPYILIN